MHSSLRSVMYIIAFLSSTIYCVPVTHNDGNDQSNSQDFPLLNRHLRTTNITTIANAEGNKSWWQKIYRTPAYAACLEMEHLLQDLYKAGYNLKSSQPETRDLDLTQFTEENLGHFIQEKIAIILGADYQEDVHKKEYALFMRIISKSKQQFEETSKHLTQTPKQRRRAISISDGSRPLWNYVTR